VTQNFTAEGAEGAEKGRDHFFELSFAFLRALCALRGESRLQRNDFVVNVSSSNVGFVFTSRNQ
jgi:hypothetical protein